MNTRLNDGGYRLLLLSGCAIGIASSALAFPAMAQTTSSAPTSSTIEEVVVTAQRRSERLVNVPATVTAVSGQQLTRSGVTSLTQINQVSVGTKIANFGVFLEPSIRGITTSVIGPGQENNIALYIDGFYEPDNSSLGGDLVNIEQVQVLKGPQGSLYGRGATGGALLLSTRGPTSTPTGDLSVSYGSYNDLRLDGFFAAPLTDHLAFSVSGYRRRMDGYIKLDNVSNGLIAPGTNGTANPYSDDDIRTKLKWTLNDRFDVTFGYHYYRYVDATGLATTPWQGFPVPPGPLRQTAQYAIAPNFKPIDLTRGHEGTVAVRWDTGVGTLSSHSYYGVQFSRFAQDQDDTLVPYSSSDARFVRRTLSESLDFATTSIDRLTLLAGLFYFHDRGRNQATFANNGPIVLSPSSFINAFSFGGLSIGSLRTESYAAYLDGTYQVTDRLFVSIGGRYNYDKKWYTARLTGNTFVPAYGLNIPYGPYDIPGKQAEFKDFIPRASLRYQIDPNTEVYASYAQGFKAGTFNALNAFNTPALTAPVRPEKATSYEGGFKTHQSRFNFSAAVYYTIYKDLQVNTDISDPVLGFQAALVNAASAHNYGVEMEGGYTPIDNLNLYAGVAYTHARFTSFPDDVTPFQSVQNSAGLRLPRAADWTATLRGDYTVHDVLRGSVTLSANAAYTSEYAPNLTVVAGPISGGPAAPYTVPGAPGQEALVQKPYTIVNLQATWKSDGGRYSITAYGENVADVRFKVFDTANLITTGAGQAVPTYNRAYSRPALYGMKFGYHF